MTAMAARAGETHAVDAVLSSAPDAASSSSTMPAPAGQKRARATRAGGERLSRNVVLNIVYNTISSLAQSIIMGQLSAQYISVLTGGDDEVVGWTSAAAGIVMVVLALPVGWLTDRFPRSSMLRTSCIAGLVASAVMFVALWFASVPWFYAASCVFGGFSALSSAPLSTILADSIESGSRRTTIFIVQYALGLLASAAGPGIAVLFFWRLGNTWDLHTLMVVMMAGTALTAASSLLLWFFSDKESLGASSEAVVDDAPVPVTGAPSTGSSKVEPLLVVVGGEGATSADATPLLADDRRQQERHVDQEQEQAATRTAPSAQAKGATLAAAAEDDGDEPECTTTHNLGHQRVWLGCFTLTTKAIPYVIFISDMVMALGAGMTVQFFSLFFKDDFHCSPIQVAGIFTAAPIAIAIFSLAAMPLGRLIGRAPASVLCNVIGTVSLFCMSLAGTGLWTNIVLYLVRTAAMNAGYPIQRAIMMDVVPKKHRGTWNALENVTAFTWTGSAALGGWLISTRDYRFTFLVTGCMYIAGTSVLFLTIPLTWGEVVDAGSPSKAAHSSTRDNAVVPATPPVAEAVDVVPATATVDAHEGASLQSDAAPTAMGCIQ